MAIAGLGDAWQPTYLAGADIVQPENYPGDGPVGLAFETMDIMGRFPYDCAPRVTCGMAWASPITSTAMFRVELYDALAAGGTGSIWFAHRGLKGSWNEPGPLMDQSGVLAKEVMQVSGQEAQTVDSDLFSAIAHVTQHCAFADSIHSASRVVLGFP
jgi:hypothetical protein